MRTKTELSEKPSLFTRIYRYFYYTNISILADDYINFAKIDPRIVYSGLWLESSPGQTGIAIPKDFAEEIILKLKNNKNIVSIDSGSQTVWIRLIAPIVSTGLGTILGMVLGTFVFPGLGTLAGALIGSAFGAGLGLFGVGLDLSVNQKIKRGFFSYFIGGMVAGAATGALVGSVVPGLGTGIGAFFGAALGGTVGIFCSLVQHMITEISGSDNNFDSGNSSIIEESEEDESTNNSSSLLAGLGGKPLIKNQQITTDPGKYVSLYTEMKKTKDQEKISSQSSTNTFI
jgi:hypothetical protein